MVRARRGEDSLSMNVLAKHLNKHPKEFTKEDIIKFIRDKDIKILNFCHVPEDCRLKTLSFPIESDSKLAEVLENGERADGSSLFSYIDPEKSDIYIVPRYATAFVNPFNVTPTLNVLCSYFDENGEPLNIAPENILRKAEQKLLKNTDVSLKLVGELEYYVIYRRENHALYPSISQRNYHESTPFVKFEALRNEALTTLAAIGVAVKYAHAEVGGIQAVGEWSMEQHEIELQLNPPQEMADAIVLAKWVLRNLGAKYGVTISFAPKIAVGHAGNGMHIHLCGMKKGKSIMAETHGKLTNEALRMIGGALRFARSLTAWGNTVPTSYLRLVPHQEAPTNICWGYHNREALVRVPLGWNFKTSLASKINLAETVSNYSYSEECSQTFELRSPDASANPYLLFAGIALSAEYGLTSKNSLKLVERLHLESKTLSKTERLPTSCAESSLCLEKDRKLYEADSVFPSRIIDKTVEKLKQCDREKAETEELLMKYLHCG